MRFDLLSLKLFVVACEQQSISRAAELEHIAASAVSKRIADLERAVKAPLFHRGPKGLELLPAAHALLHHARVILRDVVQMESELADHSAGMRGKVRMYASLSTIIQYLPHDLHEFMARYPDIDIDLEEVTSQEAVKAVAENAGDIAIFGGNPVTAGLRVLPYRTDRLVAIMPSDHPLAGADSLRFTEIARFDLVGPQKGSYLDSLVMRAAADLSHPLRLRIRVNGFEPASSMVEAKLGLALVPEQHAARISKVAQLAVIPLNEDWAVRRWKICIREGDSLPSPVQLLVDHLSSRCLDLAAPPAMAPQLHIRH
jgi:DNA-binding transcriptional LysR family regulator